MSHRAPLVALLAALAACIPLLLWIGASGSHTPRAAPTQPEHSSQGQGKYDGGQNKSERSKSIREWIAAIWEKTATDPVALFTFGLLVFTAVLAGSTIALWCITRESVALGRDQFIATHRPEIIVHTFEHSADDQSRIGAVFTFVNAGATRAKVIEIGTKIIPVSGAPRSGIQLDPSTFDNKWLDGGERGTWLVESGITEDGAIVQNMRTQPGFDAPQILCLGYIRYSDSNGRPRQTGFCRRYDADTRTWLRVENTDYEYAY